MEQQLHPIRLRYDAVRQEIEQHCGDIRRNPGDVRLIAVSKTQPTDVILAAVEAGITVFGENYAQEIARKAAVIAETQTTLQPEWHFIGHVQTNKVKMIMPFVHWIHSVDSVKLAKEISKHAVVLQKTVNVLIQVHTSGESTKFGCLPEEVQTIATEMLTLPGIHLRGLMTIGALTENPEEVRPMFRLLHTLRNELRLHFEGFSYFGAKPLFEELSMGMSNDFHVALEEGATMLRIGTAIFGARQ